MIAHFIDNTVLFLCTLIVLICTVNLIVRLKEWRAGDRVIVHRSKTIHKGAVRIHRHDKGIIINRREIQLEDGETISRDEDYSFAVTKDMENFGPIEVVFDGPLHHCSYRESLESLTADLQQWVDTIERLAQEKLEVSRADVKTHT